MITRLFSSHRFRFYLGLFLLGISIYQSQVLLYNHYYEFMMGGLLFMLSTLVPEQQMDLTKYTFSFLIFIIAGLFLDLVLGLWLTDFWFYPHYSAWDYLTISLIVYPVSGLVMIQSYLIAANYLGVEHRARRRSPDVRWPEWSLVLATAGTLFLIWMSYAPDMISKLAFSGAGTILLFIILEHFNQTVNKPSLLSNLWSQTLKVGSAILIATYANTLLTEVSNIRPNQWRYNTEVLTDPVIFDSVTLSVTVGWLALLVGPVILYYSLHNSNSFYKTFRQLMSAQSEYRSRK